MLLEILQHNNPILRQIAAEVPIEEITSKHIQDIISSMKETMHAAPGVGLAAPQVGISLQIAVIEDCEAYMSAMTPEIRKERGRDPISFHVIINPKLKIINSTEATYFEGCLSVDGVSRITPRAQKVIVQCYDENGEKRVIHAEGWYARILQHEIDHLNGKLYIDISDKHTEILNNVENRNKWLNATSEDINQYLQNATKIEKSI
jgi:peptide deformylase